MMKTPANEYIERHNIKAILNDALSILLEKRPQKPLKYLHEYFSHFADGNNIHERNFNYLQLHPQNKLNFIRKLTLITQGLKSNKHISINDFIQLGTLIIYDFATESKSLFKNLEELISGNKISSSRSDSEVLGTSNMTSTSNIYHFGSFFSYFRTYFYYQDFIDRLKTLFTSLDVDHSNKIDKHIFFLSIESLLASKTNHFCDPPIKTIHSSLENAPGSNVCTFNEFFLQFSNNCRTFFETDIQKFVPK